MYLEGNEYMNKCAGEDQQEPTEATVIRVGVWCEMAASLQEREPGKRWSPLLEYITQQRSEDRDWKH